MSDFFLVEPDYSLRNALVLEVDMANFPKERHPNAVSLNPKIISDMMNYEWPIQSAIPCNVLEGRAWTDYVQNTLQVFICQASVLKILNDLKVDSFSTTPILFYSNSKSKRCDPPPTPLAWLRMPVGCGPMHQTGYLSFPRDGLRGVKFDLESWTGAEIFRPPTGSLFFISRRIAMAFQAAKLTGMRIVAADEME